MGYLSKAVTTTASYLPAQVTDTLNQTRAVATVTVPNSPVIAPNTVAIANISRQTRLLLASSDGYLYIYNLPGEQRVIITDQSHDSHHMFSMFRLQSSDCARLWAMGILLFARAFRCDQ